jgi:DNA invertase Pin-like site-specific DNA recombinase
MSQNTGKIRVVGYARVSTTSDDQLNSYDNQKSYFETEVNKIENHELVKVYGDPGVSGVLLLERESFVEMLKDAGVDVIAVKNEEGENKRIAVANSKRKPEFDYIFVKDISRLARNIGVQAIIE